MANPHICHACGDAACKKWNHRWYCWDCYEELANGIIKCEPIKPRWPTSGTHHIEYIDDGDASPWQENVIRQLEDG